MAVKGTPLMLGPVEQRALADLRELALENPVDMVAVMEQLKTPEGKRRHLRQMTAQSIQIPTKYVVTFSIEENHPCGTCRHMSMSVDVAGRAPNEFALWMIALELGFWGALAKCTVYPEQLQGSAGVAINLIQPIEQPVEH